jgi:predicted dehydrogenase
MGMAGLGVASTQILPSVARLLHIKITAAVDVRKDALGKFREEYGGETFGTVEEMCKSDKIDFVYIATPNELHAEHVITAAKHGKHAIVEKPMALSIEQCDAMNDAAEKYGTKLLCGHTHSFDPPIRKIREIVKNGELGKLCMINTWNYNEFMYRPRMKHELATSHGVVLNQGPHGQPRAPETNLNVRRRLKAISDPSKEESLKEQMRYGGQREGEYSHRSQGERKQPFFGFTLVTCEKGDIRQSQDGLIIYGDEEKREVPLQARRIGREAEMDELYNAVVNDRPVFHDGRWGEATLEVCLAILESAKQRREISVSHQVPSPE